MPVSQTGGRGLCCGRGQMLTVGYWENLPFHANGTSSRHARRISWRFSSKRGLISIGGIRLLGQWSYGNPTGNPATNRPPLTVSIVAYSSATFKGSRVLPRERPAG